MRDTVIVPPGAMVTVAVQFDKPGDWYLHCHHLYHMAGGMMTSVQVARENPVVVGAWGLIVAVGLAIGILPILIGLIVVLPLLGHATWHLYRAAVV